MVLIQKEETKTNSKIKVQTFFRCIFNPFYRKKKSRFTYFSSSHSNSQSNSEKNNLNLSDSSVKKEENSDSMEKCFLGNYDNKYFYKKNQS